MIRSPGEKRGITDVIPHPIDRSPVAADSPDIASTLSDD